MVWIIFRGWMLFDVWVLLKEELWYPFNPLIMNDVIRHHPTLTQLSGEIPIWHTSAKRRHEGCVVAPSKTAGTGSPVLLVSVSCRYLLVNHCSFFFSHRSGKFWLYLEKQPKPRACNWVGMVGRHGLLHFCFSGEATLLHSSGVIPCACS